MVATNYDWDPINDNVLTETEDSGTEIAAYWAEPRFHGKLTSQRRDGHSYFHMFDNQGTSRVVTDANSGIAEAAIYSAFGETITKTTSIANPFAFKGSFGYYTNSLSVDVYVRARQYHPAIARWLSQDPLGLSMGNLYLYVDNRPLVYADPSGLDYGLEFGDCNCKCGCNTIACTQAGAAAILARRFTDFNFDANGRRQGGQGDAYRHCVWNCFMVINLPITEACAKCIADNHEERNRADGSAQEHIDMDLHNNEVGRRIGRDCWTVWCCSSGCLHALEDGDLVVIR